MGQPSVADTCFHGGEGRLPLLLQRDAELLYNPETKSGLEQTAWCAECRGKVEEVEEILAACSHKGVL